MRSSSGSPDCRRDERLRLDGWARSRLGTKVERRLAGRFCNEQGCRPSARTLARELQSTGGTAALGKRRSGRSTHATGSRARLCPVVGAGLTRSRKDEAQGALRASRVSLVRGSSP